MGTHQQNSRRARSLYVAQSTHILYLRWHTECRLLSMMSQLNVYIHHSEGIFATTYALVSRDWRQMGIKQQHIPQFSNKLVGRCSMEI